MAGSGPDAAIRRLGRYHLVEPLGGGPTGEVFRAKVYGVAGFERQFAVKRFHPELVKDPEVAAEIAAAARKYGSLEHPRIARLQEYGVAGGETFSAVEFVVGLDVARLNEAAANAGTTLVTGAVVDLVSQASRAIGFAHGRGISHLGICPTNLVCNEEGVVKVTDFGLLPPRLPRRPANDYSLSMRISYLAPEQLVGEPTSSATDVFQLGLVAYELFTGKRAFSGPTPLEVSQKILSSVPEEPSLPKALLKVLMRCMARSPFERYPDAGALADALDAASRVTPIPGGQRDIANIVRQGIRTRQEISGQQVSGALSFPLPAPPSSAMSELLRQGVAAPGAAASDDQAAPKKTIMGVPVPKNVQGLGDELDFEHEHLDDDDTQVRSRAVGFVKPRAPFAPPTSIPRIPGPRAAGAPPPPPPLPNKSPRAEPIAPAATGTPPLAPFVPPPPGFTAPPGPSPVSAQGHASPPPPPPPPARAAYPAPSLELGPPDGAGAPPPPPSMSAPLDGLFDGEPDDQGMAPLAAIEISPPDTLSDEPPTLPRGALMGNHMGADDEIGELELLPLPLMPDPPAPLPSPSVRSRGVPRALVAVLAVAVVGGGGFFAYTQFSGGDDGNNTSAAKPQPKPQHPATKSALGSDAGAHKVAEVPADGGTSAIVTRPPTSDAQAVAASAADAGPVNKTSDARTAVATKVPPDAAVDDTDSTPPPNTTSGGDGKLRIASTPSGAKIYIDGTFQGRTPKTLDEYPDNHKLVLIKPGYKLFTGQVSGGSAVNQTLVEVSPPGGPAGIKVRCKKKNRYYVFVDGHDVGMLCPTERIGVDKGKHEVEIYDPVTDSRRTFQADVKQTRNSVRVRVD